MTDDSRFADRTTLLVRNLAAHSALGTRLAAWPDEPLGSAAWDDLTAEVRLQRVWSMLAHAIADSSLPATSAQADQAFEQDEAAVLACLHLDRVLRDVWQALAAEGIETRVFKGVSSALIAYPEAGLRTYSDVDLLVPSSRFDDASTVVTSMGGQRHNPEPRAGFTAALGKSAGFTLDGGWEIDLHRSPQGGPFGAAVPTAELFEHSTPLAVGGLEVEALSLTHLFITACYHAILPRDQRRLVPHLDVAVMLASGLVDEDAVIRTAARWRGSAAVAAAIRSASTAFSMANDTPLVGWATTMQEPWRQRRWLRACQSERPGSDLAVGLLTATAFPRRLDGVRYLESQLLHDARLPARRRLRRLARRFRAPDARSRAPKGRPRTVFQVVDTLAIGGAERMAVEISNGLARRNWKVHLFATREQGPLVHDVADPVIVCDLGRRSRWDLRGLRQFRSAVKSERPLAVHAHGWSSMRFATAALAGVRDAPALVLHDHGSSGLPAQRTMYKLTAWTLTSAHVAVDRSLLDPPLSMRRRSFSVAIPNGAPLDQIALKEDYRLSTPPRLVMVANIRPPKDHPLLLNALDRAVRRGTDLEVDLVGATSDRAHLAVCSTLIETLRLDDRVTILGPRTDVGSLLAGYDVGLLSSSTESGPIALIEYLAAGLPFVVTDVGEIPAMLPAGLRRWVVPAGDANALAEAIEDVLSLSPHERAAFAAEGLAFAREQLSIERTIAAVEEVYRRLVQD